MKWIWSARYKESKSNDKCEQKQKDDHLYQKVSMNQARPWLRDYDFRTMENENENDVTDMNLCERDSIRNGYEGNRE